MKMFNCWFINNLLYIVKNIILTSLLVFPVLSSAAHTTTAAGVDCDFGLNSSPFYNSFYSSTATSMTGVCIDSRGPSIKGSATVSGGAGVLRSKSTLSFSGLGTLGGGTWASGINAQSRITYLDTLTFNLAGLAVNDDAMVRVTLRLNGFSSARSDNRTVVNAIGDLRASINGSWGYTSVWESSNGAFNDKPVVTWDIPIRNGVDVPVNIILKTLANMVDGYQYGSGKASADFSNTGGITSFEYFALDGTPLSGSFASIEGFNLYDPTVVPIPAALWLFGSGLLGLVAIAKRKKSVH